MSPISCFTYKGRSWETCFCSPEPSCILLPQSGCNWKIQVEGHYKDHHRHAWVRRWWKRCFVQCLGADDSWTRLPDSCTVRQLAFTKMYMSPWNLLYWRCKWMAKVIFTGPKPSWLVGCAASIMSDNQIFMFQKWMQTFGPKPFAVSLGAKSMVVISDPDDVRYERACSLLVVNMEGTSTLIFPNQHQVLVLLRQLAC